MGDSVLQIHGVTGSRTLRVLWMVEELGIPYVQHPVNFREDASAPEFLAINPNGRVPAIVDGEVVIWESMAINLHLARTRASSLTPDDFVAWSRAEMWSFWVMTECEKSLLSAIVAKQGLFGYEANEARAMRRFAELDRPLKVLDDHLAVNNWIIADRFTVADLNVASVLLWLVDGEFPLDAYPRLSAWLHLCLDREGLTRARSR